MVYMLVSQVLSPKGKPTISPAAQVWCWEKLFKLLMAKLAWKVYLRRFVGALGSWSCRWELPGDGMDSNVFSWQLQAGSSTPPKTNMEPKNDGFS